MRRTTLLVSAPTALAICAMCWCVRGRFLRALRALRIRYHPAPPKKPLLTFSVGSYCLTAHTLGQAGARAFAGPFDWIFSHPRIVAHVISDGGESLLDAANYTALGTPDRKQSQKVGHRVYSQMVGRSDGLIFNHHDPRDNADDHAYFRRAVARLRLALDNQHQLPLLFVLCSIERRQPLIDADIDHLFRVLRKHSLGASSLQLVAVRIHAPSQKGRVVGARKLRTERLPLHAHASDKGGDGVASLHVWELQCRGELGAMGLSLADARDRQDLLMAIFGEGSLSVGNSGSVDGRSSCKLNRPLAPCPLASRESGNARGGGGDDNGDGGSAGSGGEHAGRSWAWRAGRFAKARKYADDAFLTAGIGVPKSQGRSGRPSRSR
jgi:hypothetical protein